MDEVTFKEVKRKHFNEIADLIWDTKEFQAPVHVWYEGSGLQGRMVLSVTAGNTKVFNKALQMVTDILTGKTREI